MNPVSRAGLLIAAALLAGASPSKAERYATGQVWEYRTRPGDAGSLLKIQKIERDPRFAKTGPVYHISVIGFHLGNPRIRPVLPHAAVGKRVLDASVTRLSRVHPPFPDAVPGIVQWQEAHGGVYNIPVAQIIDALDRSTRNMGGGEGRVSR
jgi:hypothetical protein